MQTVTLETINQIQANLITYFRLFAGLPGITFVEEEVTWIAAGNNPPGNHILRTQFPMRGVERRIATLLAQIGEHCDETDWQIFPSCQPADLARRVEKYGLVDRINGTWRVIDPLDDTSGQWLLADLKTLSTETVVDADMAEFFHIEKVSNLAMLEEWQEISEEGFDIEDCQSFYDAYAQDGFDEKADAIHYIGYYDEQPVTSGTLLRTNSIAGLFDVSTSPLYRGWGFASALCLTMLYEAKTCGIQQACVCSSDMGQSLYRRIGFTPIDIGIRQYQLQRW